MGAITQARLDELRTSFQLGFQNGLNKGMAEAIYPQLVVEIPSDAASNVYGWLAQQMTLREWIGPREALDIGEHAKELFNRDFERTVKIDRNKIEDNKLWDYPNLVFPQLGMAAAKHPDALLFEFLSANKVCWDGKALFAEDHPNFNKTGVGDTTYQNDYDLAFSPENLATVVQDRALILGEDGQPAGVKSNIILHGPKLRKAVLEVLSGDYLPVVIQNVAADQNVAAAAQRNVLSQYGLSGREWDRITDESWYVLDTSGFLKPFVFQRRRPLEFVAMTQTTDERVFTHKEYRWGVDTRYAMGETMPWLVTRSVPES